MLVAVNVGRGPVEECGEFLELSFDHATEMFSQEWVVEDLRAPGRLQKAPDSILGF